jgi:hypothetical protein
LHLWNWITVVICLAGSALFGKGLPAFLKYLSDRSIERQKAQQSRELLAAQNVFSVGVTSRMATVAFDKHIEFCEEYVKEMSEALHALIQNGKPEEMLDTRRLSIIREKWALWLTHEIENKLDEVERRIRLVGGPAQVFKADGTPASNAGALAGIIKDVITFLREEVLRMEELTALRNELVKCSLTKPPQVV